MAKQRGGVQARGVDASEAARLGWLALTLAPGMGPQRCMKAIERLGTAERVLETSLTELEGAGLPAAAAQFLADGRGRRAAIEQLERTRQFGAELVTFDDAAYPGRLLEIFDPPTVLWVRGNVEALSAPGIAVVGTRHPSDYGQTMTTALCRDLARRGAGIFSGMARGIDTAAHAAALEVGGLTVAVWGTGIDVVYPKENRRLADEIVARGGALVSEFPLGSFPAPQNFPIRNRTLSGMSIGVLVVEAGEHSGTRITARCAIEQNRDVYAVPGNVTNKNAWGPNTLIKQGAKLTATWEDVWEDLPSQVRVELEDTLLARRGESKPAVAASLFSDDPASPMKPAERLILTELRPDEAMQLDDLIERLQGRIAAAEIFTALFELELNGQVRQRPGKNYVRAL